MFLEDLVILVHFLIFFLHLGSPVFALVLDPSGAFQLGLVFIEFLILNGFDSLKLLELTGLVLDLLLQLLHVQRCLSLGEVLLTFKLLHRADVLIKVAVVKGLDLSYRSVTRIQLLLQLGYFRVLSQDDIIALLAFPEQLHYSPSQAVEIVQHYKSVDVLKRFFSISIHRLWVIRLSKCLSDQLMDPLRGKEFFFDFLQARRGLGLFESTYVILS